MFVYLYEVFQKGPNKHYLKEEMIKTIQFVTTLCNLLKLF